MEGKILYKIWNNEKYQQGNFTLKRLNELIKRLTISLCLHCSPLFSTNIVVIVYDKAKLENRSF